MAGNEATYDRRYVEVLQVLDDGRVLVRSSEGNVETWVVPLERVPHYRRLIERRLDDVERLQGD